MGESIKETIQSDNRQVPSSVADVGAVVGTYPVPVTVVGTMVNGNVNWINIAHVGVIGVDSMVLSIGRSHYSTSAIQAHKTCSVNIISESMMIPADFVGLHSGLNVDKSRVFDWYLSCVENAPLIKDAPIAMACRVESVHETMTHINFFVKPIHTFVQQSCLDSQGLIDYVKVRPLLFEMPKRRYFGIGEVLGQSWSVGAQFVTKG